jgi:CBS domain-containing protein
MTKGIVYCRMDDEIDNAIEAMKKNKIRRLTVLDGNKRMVGMLSLGDVACAASKNQCTEVMQAVSAHHA